MNDELQTAWRIEQHKVASQVILQPNPDIQIQTPCTNTQSTPIHNANNNANNALSQDEFQSLPIHAHHRLGGVDVSFGPNNQAIAVYVITQGPQILYRKTLSYELTVPYISSYLSYREIHPLTTLVHAQQKSHPKVTPTVILVDGNGIFHERRAGIASFLGVWTGIPTIGVAKSLYCMDGITKECVLHGLQETLHAFLKGRCDCPPFESGAIHEGTCEDEDENQHEKVVFCTRPIVCKPKDEMNHKMPPPSSSSTSTACSIPKEPRMSTTIPTLGESIPKLNSYYGMAIPIQGKRGDILAAALVGHGGRIQTVTAGTKQNKTQKQCGTKTPIFISIGHNVSLQEAIQICAGVSYAKIPEPVRQADLIGRDLLRQSKKQEEEEEDEKVVVVEFDR